MTGPLARPSWRLVIDTNVLVSYALFGREPIRSCFAYARDHGSLLFSKETLDEIAEVIRRPKFDRNLSQSARNLFLTELIGIAIKVCPADTPALCRDPKDDMLLAVAVAGGADMLITGDRDLPDLGSIGGTRILTPAEFAALIP